LRSLNSNGVEYLVVGGYAVGYHGYPRPTGDLDFLPILTTISGVEFPACYARRTREDIEGMEISLIALQDLKTNKKASGRHRDLDDLQNLP
jgi:hypothetical protein